LKRLVATSLFVLLAAVAAAKSPALPEVPADDRPNLVLNISDDHRWDLLGAAGNPAAVHLARPGYRGSAAAGEIDRRGLLLPAAGRLAPPYPRPKVDGGGEVEAPVFGTRRKTRDVEDLDQRRSRSLGSARKIPPSSTRKRSSFLGCYRADVRLCLGTWADAGSPG